MDDPVAVELVPRDVLIPAGTRVSLHPEAAIVDRNLVVGGSPWRVLRLRGSSRAVLDQWRSRGVVATGQERLARTLVSQDIIETHFDNLDVRHDLDVVVPVFNDVAGLEHLLATLRGFNVTVVDDASTKQSDISRVVTNFGATLLRLSHNEGPAGARNHALATTERRFVFFVDSDITIDEPSELIARLASHFNDPLVAAVAPRIRGSKHQGLRASFEEEHCPLDLGPVSSLVVPKGRVSYVPSACLLVRRQAVGTGFDPTLRVGEDVDFVWRLHDEGWLVRYDATVEVRHDARATWSQWLFQRYSYGRSAGTLALRYHDRLAPVRADAMTLASWTALLLGRPALAFSLLRSTRANIATTLEGVAYDVEVASNAIVRQGVLRAGGPLARSLVRAYGPLIVLGALLPRVRRPLLFVYTLGTAWRWRRATTLRVREIPLGVADDLAYASGVLSGAVRTRGWWAIRPSITGSDALRRASGLPVFSLAAIVSRRERAR